MRGSRSRRLTRRQTLGIAAGAGAAAAFGGRRSGFLGGEAADAAQATAAQTNCTLTAAKTEGPYFVDVGLNRSDIRSDTSDGSVEAGVPLALTINVLNVDDSCAPVAGAIVDVWHCNSQGLYSDVTQNGTVGQTFLRGLQVTDANGSAKFTTIYPGWYAGRTIHIHFKVRTFNASGQAVEFFTSQFFFDEATNNAVMAQAPYNARSGRTTLNSNDGIFSSRLILPLSSDGSGGYTGTLDVGVTGVPSGTGSANTVEAALKSVRFARAGDDRTLNLVIETDEALRAKAKLIRGGKALAHASEDLASGKRTLRLELPARVEAGPAKLKLELTDAAGAAKTVDRRLRVPAP